MFCAFHPCPLLPLASSPMQPLGVPIILGLAAAMAVYGYRQGVFLATLAGLHAFVSVIAALGLMGPIGAWIELADVPRHYAVPSAFFGVLVGAGVAIHLLIGAAVPPQAVSLPAPMVDRAAGLLIGGLAGLIAAGGVLLAFSVAPLPPAWRIHGSELSIDMGSRMLNAFSRCLGADARTRELLLRGEPGTPPAAGQTVVRPAWSEPFADTNGNLAHDEGEPFVDTDSNKTFTTELNAADTNGNGRRDVGLLEHYRLGHWLPLTMLQAPVITSDEVADVDDGKPKEKVVYQAAATDANQGDVLVYSVKPDQGDDAALVLVDPASGAVTLANPPDQEMQKVYTFTIVATDKAGLTAERPVTLHVTK